MKLSTTNSKITLGPELQAKSVRVPVTTMMSEEEKKKNVTEAWFEINGKGGHSVATIKSTNAPVKASFTTEGFVGARGEDPNKGPCVIM